MNPTKFIFARETQPDNASVIWSLRLIAPNKYSEILKSFKSPSFDGLKIDFLADANHKNDHWKVPVPGGTQENAEIMAEEIERHLRKHIDQELDFEVPWTRS